MVFYHRTKRNHWSIKWFSRSPFVRCFPRGLERFEDNRNIPWNLPNIFRPSRIEPVLQKSLPQFSVPRSQQCHSSRNGEALVYNDSRIILHKLCQFPKNCEFLRLWDFPTARETFANSFPCPANSCSYTGLIVSIEWQNLVPRLRIGDCFEIHILH